MPTSIERFGWCPGPLPPSRFPNLPSLHATVVTIHRSGLSKRAMHVSTIMLQSISQRVYNVCVCIGTTLIREYGVHLLCKQAGLDLWLWLECHTWKVKQKLNDTWTEIWTEMKAQIDSDCFGCSGSDVSPSRTREKNTEDPGAHCTL